MLVLLIPITIILLFVVLIGMSPQQKGGWGAFWQQSLLLSISIFGSLLVLISELLSIFDAITAIGLVISWSVIGLAILAIGLGLGWLQIGWQQFKSLIRIRQRSDYLFWLLAGALILTLMVVAWISPSNNIDALQYHMPRVDHWAQEQSLKHFPVQNQSQNSRPYWAEAAILHLRILWGSDQPANLVQWFCMLATMAGVAGIVRLLNGTRLAQWFSGFLVLSIPMGVLQATSTQNDYVATYWVISLAFFVIDSINNGPTRINLLGASLSLALGMLTKGTFFPFAALLMTWFYLHRWRKTRPRALLASALFTIIVVILLNLGFWARNFETYGGPYGTKLPVSILQLEGKAWEDEQEQGASPTNLTAKGVSQERSGIILTGRALEQIRASGATSLQVAEQFRTMGARFLRMIAMNYVTPFHAINSAVFGFLGLFPGIFNDSFLGSMKVIAWNSDLGAGSPVHLTLILLASVYLWLHGTGIQKGVPAIFSLAALGGFFLLTPIHYSDWVFSIRYQLPYLAMGCAIVAIVIARIDRHILSAGIALAFLYAMPYLLFNNTRPVIGRTPWPTRVGSVFTTEPVKILFAQSPENRDEYEYVVGRINDVGCRQVGISIATKDQEYPIWWLLQAPQSGVVIQHMTYPDNLMDLASPGFSPCAIICTFCSGESAFQSLALESDFGHVQLYLR